MESAVRRMEGKLARGSCELENGFWPNKGADYARKLIRDVKRLKNWQDMLFAKQNIMQATLAGTPLTQNYCSHNGSCIITWSPVP